MFEPNNAENREENSLDLSQYPKANLISRYPSLVLGNHFHGDLMQALFSFVCAPTCRKHLVVTMGGIAGEFTVENFARNATHLNSEYAGTPPPKRKIVASAHVPSLALHQAPADR